MLKGGFIKIDRAIVNWRWYGDGNTLRVFLHLLLIANYEDKDFQNIVVRRGEAVTSYSKLADSLGLSVRGVRTAIEHLKSTGEVTSRTYNKFQVISIVNYDSYQSNRQAKRQADDSQTTGNRQATDNNGRKIKNNIRIKEGADAPDTVLSDEKGAPPEGFSTWEEYYDYLRG